MKFKIMLVTTLLLLGASDLIAQNQIVTTQKPDLIGIYCVGYGIYKDEKEKLILTEDENKMNAAVLRNVDPEVCMMVATNMVPVDTRKEVSDKLKKAGYPTELVSEVFPICKQWEWTKTRCVDTYKSLYDKKAKFLEERYDEADRANKELDKRLGY